MIAGRGLRRAGLVLAASLGACGDSAPTVVLAPVDLFASPAEAFAQGDSVAVLTVLDAATAQEVQLTTGASVSVRVSHATVVRIAQPSRATVVAAGARITADLHVAISQLDSDGHVTGRIDNPYADTPGRARFDLGRTVLATLGADLTDATAWRVWDAYQLSPDGTLLAEPALGFAAGTPVATLFGSLHPP